MIGFAVGALVLTALALWFLVRPLTARRDTSGIERNKLNLAVYRDQLRELDADLNAGLLSPEEHDRSRREIEARLLEDERPGEAGTAAAAPRHARWTAIAVALFVPVGAAIVYLLVGAPVALDPQIVADNAAEHSVDQKELEAMVDTLAQRMKENPGNAEGWVMLARSYKHFKRYDDAARAYGRAAALLPPNPDLLADYADVLGMAQGQKLAGQPEKLIAQALELDPKHLKALALAGSAAYERQNYAAAAKYWQQMLPLVPPDSDQARAIQANVAEARGLAGVRGDATVATAPAAPPAPSAAEVQPSAVAAQGGVTGVVKLAPELAGKVAPTDIVLIYARAAEGSRMPLAIVRKEARELPIAFQLDDSSAMQPGMTLSKHDRVIVSARVSRTASATARAGDLEGASPAVTNTARDITVVIDREVR